LKEGDVKKLVLAALVMALLVTMAACGDSPSVNDPERATELHVSIWSDYIDPDIYVEFENEFGFKVVEHPFSSNEDLLAKAQDAAAGYDLIVPNDRMLATMIDLGLLAELNHDNIPNLSNIDETFKDPPYDPGNKFSVPYQWGTTGIGYDIEVFEDAPASWAYLFDPDLAGAHSGQMTMLDDARESFAAALRYLGYSLNSTDERQIGEAKDLLLQQKEWVLTYDSNGFADSLAEGDTVLAHGWSREFFLAAMEVPNVWHAIPEEGGVIWTDNLAVPLAAPNKLAAEAFINYLLRPEVGAKATNYTWFASPNQASEEFLDPEILEEPGIYPSREVMDRLEFIRDVGEAAEVYERMWSEITAE
jgi:spermidine/putrescine-binding protein